jgi:hypothetical protein
MKINNDIVRALFNDYYMKNMKPNLQMLAKEIGVGYFYLIKWRKGKDIAEESLMKIITYIQKKQQSA